MNDLESQTYEIFEKDATKYIAYENALHQALLERHASNAEASTSGESGHAPADEPPVHIMVLGAGRGPLVRASLRAGACAIAAASCTQPQCLPKHGHAGLSAAAHAAVLQVCTAC